MLLYALLIAGIGFRTTDFTYRIVPPFGFYLATALYMGLFAWWLGRYRGFGFRWNFGLGLVRGRSTLSHGQQHYQEQTG